MKEEILKYIDNPAHLEKMYRSNKSSFKKAYHSLYPELKGQPIAEFWNERLNYENEEINWGSRFELLLVVAACLFAGFIAKIPILFSIDEDFFFPRNISFIVFPMLTGYFAWKNNASFKTLALLLGVMLFALFYINTLPMGEASDSLILACIHLPLFLWSVLGFSFSTKPGTSEEKRLAYLKYNGDLVVMTALILIAGGIMTGITIGLFSLIGLNIEEFYFQNIGIFGIAGAPIVGTYLTQTNPQLVGKVSPVIAKLFSPLVLIMLVSYLIAIAYSGKDPYNDREFLMIFNLLLIGVMAIIFFSVAGTDNSSVKSPQVWILLLLSAVTIIVNSVALSAILFRISEWGVTPNRIAVLGGNVLILVNLLLVTTNLFKVASKKAELSAVGRSIVSYLPIYTIWAVIVTFLFPLFFGFK